MPCHRFAAAAADGVTLPIAGRFLRRLATSAPLYSNSTVTPAVASSGPTSNVVRVGPTPAGAAVTEKEHILYRLSGTIRSYELVNTMDTTDSDWPSAGGQTRSPAHTDRIPFRR